MRKKAKGIIKFMKTAKDYFNQFYSEIEKYKQGIHVLNHGITEEELTDFEDIIFVYPSITGNG